MPSLLSPEAAHEHAGGPSLSRFCSELAQHAVAGTPGSCAAAVTLTDPEGRPLDGGCAGPAAVTHPDVSGLVAVQWDHGEGPVPEALSSGEPVLVRDVLRETRWPRYRAASLQRGLRACTTIPYRHEGAVLTVSLYAFRPDGLAGVAAGEGPGLAELAADVLGREGCRREAGAEGGQFGSGPGGSAGAPGVAGPAGHAGRRSRVPSQTRRSGP